jgi:hypothetical protein
MAFVLTENSTVSCPSSGTVSTTGQAKLKVTGGKVLVLDGINGKSVSGCTVVTNTNSGTKQCLTVASASGTAAKLKVGGKAVALSTLTGSTDGTTPTLSATANQTKLKAS